MDLGYESPPLRLGRGEGATRWGESLLGNGEDRPSHRSQPDRKLIPPRSRDHQPFLRPRHPYVEELHVLGDLGFRKTQDLKTQDARLESWREEGD